MRRSEDVMTMKSYVRRLTAIGMIGLIPALAAPPISAQDSTPMVPTGQYGLMGAIRGETARLSISNFAIVSDPNIPPDPCRATIAFVDEAGADLLRQDGTSVRRSVSLEAGQSASLRVNAGAFLRSGETRLNFRPVVLVGRQPDPNIPPDPCVASFEIIDNATGQTRLVNPGGVSGIVIWMR